MNKKIYSSHFHLYIIKSDISSLFQTYQTFSKLSNKRKNCIKSADKEKKH